MHRTLGILFIIKFFTFSHPADTFNVKHLICGTSNKLSHPHLDSSPLRHRDLPHTIHVVVVGLWVTRGQNGTLARC